jgi:hypothetical protein
MDDAGRYELDLGEVSVGAAWNGWLEVNGSVQITGGITLIPTDAYIETTGASPGRQMVGAVTIADPLNTTSAQLNGRTIPNSGGQTWSGPATGWPVSAANWARRDAVSMASPVIATGGTGNYLNADVKFQTRTTLTSFAAFTTSNIITGAVLRHQSTSNYVVAGWRTIADDNSAVPVLAKVSNSSGTTTVYYLWQGSASVVSGFGSSCDWNVQITDDGRWFISIREASNNNYQEASGQDADFVSGGHLGNASNAKVGLYDWWAQATPTMNRDITDFKVSALTAVTQPPIPSGATITLAGPKMLSSSNADLPYLGSSGIDLEPGAANNVTVFARRVNGIASSTTTKSDALDVDIDGWPRFLSVPHS